MKDSSLDSEISLLIKQETSPLKCKRLSPSKDENKDLQIDETLDSSKKQRIHLSPINDTTHLFNCPKDDTVSPLRDEKFDIMGDEITIHVKDENLNPPKDETVKQPKVETLKHPHDEITNYPIKFQNNAPKNPYPFPTNISILTSHNICHKCEIVFDTAELFNRHISSTHNEAEDEPYSCDICGKSFTYLKHWEKHKQLHEDNAAKLKSMFSNGFGIGPVDMKSNVNKLTEEANEAVSVEAFIINKQPSIDPDKPLVKVKNELDMNSDDSKIKKESVHDSESKISAITDTKLVESEPSDIHEEIEIKNEEIGEPDFEIEGITEEEVEECDPVITSVHTEIMGPLDSLFDDKENNCDENLVIHRSEGNKVAANSDPVVPVMTSELQQLSHNANQQISSNSELAKTMTVVTTTSTGDNLYDNGHNVICPKCVRKFPSQIHLDKHMKLHETNTDRIMIAPLNVWQQLGSQPIQNHDGLSNNSPAQLDESDVIIIRDSPDHGNNEPAETISDNPIESPVEMVEFVDCSNFMEQEVREDDSQEVIVGIGEEDNEQFDHGAIEDIAHHIVYHAEVVDPFFHDDDFVEIQSESDSDDDELLLF
eukprot:TRINITY_DN30665_c0_g2_i2.p1 TRINITY_DN30665_c0_g2~~TRINITY_DN30665_c0_g2_i2.p1  ORF type:complete len:621 (+),score=115.21 TRINITY_DN30665_c0_g2_i2:76-1863(+)